MCCHFLYIFDYSVKHFVTQIKFIIIIIIIII